MAGNKTLLKAVTSGRTRQVRLLLDLGAATEDVDECGQTPLIRAIFVDNDRNRDKMIKMLLKKGSVVSKADVVGRSALSWACMYGRDKDVATLLEYADIDLDLNMADINGQTALFHAVSSGNAATVKLMVNALQKYSMSVDSPDSNGVSPLMHANRLGHDICASILIHGGNARVGLSQHNNENISRKEKWAISSLRERSRIKNLKRQSQFPPISNKPDDASIKSRNNRKHRHFGKVPQAKQYDSDSSSDGEYEDSLFLGHQNVLSNDSGFSPRTSTNVRNCLQHVPPCYIPSSILKSSSSLFNVSSDNDSEVDSIASTIVEGRPVVKTTVDLPSMYEYYTEQMSSSFRQPARKVPEKQLEPPTRGVEEDRDPDNVDTVKEKELRDLSVQKWTKLKKNIRMTGLSKINKLKSAILTEPSPRNNETTTTTTVNRSNFIASLPDIYVERKDQQPAHSPQ